MPSRKTKLMSFSAPRPYCATGKPKGVMIQHRALYHFVQFIKSRWGLGENSRIALHSNFTFDAAVEDLFPPLAAGGTVCIVPESARRDPEEMRAFLRRYSACARASARRDYRACFNSDPS